MSTPITGWRRFITIEPLAFIFLFTYSISENVMTDLIVYQTCKTTIGINSSECTILHDNSSSKEAMQIKKLVQPHAGLILILRSCIEVIFPTIMTLFIGPWSDKNGRKPLLVIPFAGFLLYYISAAILCSFNVNPYWFLLASVPKSLLGGFPAELLTFFSYITDITDNKSRTWHLAFLETTLYAGVLAGLFVGPIVFNEFNYTAVFTLSAAFCFFALLYAIFIVKETIETENLRTLKSIFNYTLVKELLCTVIEKRNGIDRCLVWSCILAIALHVVVLEGNSSIGFLFTSSNLGWDISQYSIYSGISLLISISGMLFLIKFVASVLKLPETVTIILSCLSISAGGFIKAFVSKPWHMYLCSGVAIFSGATVPVIKAILSKSVPQKDVGKIFSITTTMEMIIPFATTPLYMYIYTHTLNRYPSPVWFVSAAIPFLILILACIIERRWRQLKNVQYVSFETSIN